MEYRFEILRDDKGLVVLQLQPLKIPHLLFQLYYDMHKLATRQCRCSQVAIGPTRLPYTRSTPILRTLAYTCIEVAIAIP